MRIVISAGGTGGHIYPALAIINKIKEKEPKSEVLYIGDSEVDINTAKNAGIDGLFLSYGYRPKEELLKYSTNIIDDALSIIDYLK